MAKFNSVTHCIFDMDGLILDTEKLAFRVTQNILNKHTNPIRKHTWEVKESLLGLQADDVAKKIVETYQLPITWQEYRDMSKEQVSFLMKSCRVCVGVDRLLRHLHKNKIGICVATSSSKESFEIKTLRHRELFAKFNHIVLGASDPEVKIGKPAPDIFLVAASRFPDKPKPENCLVFEDSPSGIRAALQAGMQVVAVPDPRVSKCKLKGATVVLNSMLEFVPEDFGLPSFAEE